MVNNTVVKIKQFLVVIGMVVKIKQFYVVIHTVVKFKTVFCGYSHGG